jgi:hypothetical protein
MDRQTIDTSELLSTRFDTEKFLGVDRAIKRRPIGVQITERGVHLFFATGDEVVIPSDHISDWHFEGRHALFIYDGLSLKPGKGRRPDRLIEGNSALTLIQLTVHEIDQLRRQFNLLRVRNYLASMDAKRRLRVALVQCPECELVYDGEGEGRVGFCPECLAMLDGGRNLCIERGYLYNFCGDGWFDFLGCDRDEPRSLPSMMGGNGFLPFSKVSGRYLRKIGSHFLWILLWVVGWWLARLLPEPYNNLTGYALLFLCFTSALFMSSYILTLFFKGWLRPALLNPAWGRLILRMRRRLPTTLSESLEEHPGFLSNRALLTGQLTYLERAVELCPTHPALLELMTRLTSDGQRERWEKLQTVALRRAALFP